MHIHSLSEKKNDLNKARMLIVSLGQFTSLLLYTKQDFYFYSDVFNGSKKFYKSYLQKDSYVYEFKTSVCVE